MLQPKLKVAVGDINRILLVFSVTLIIYANPALSQLGECSVLGGSYVDVMWKR